MANTNDEVSTYTVFVGTSTEGASEGLYSLRLEAGLGRLSLLETIPSKDNPTFLAVDQECRRLYSADHPGRDGLVKAWSIDPARGKATLINQQPAVGPCHVSIAPSGRYIMVANYGAGSVEAFPVREDGGLAPASGFVQHKGASVHPTRQSGPHAHSVTFAPGGRYVYAADLGLDQILCYLIDEPAGCLIPGEIPVTHVAPGAGPRHMAFHPGGRFAYVINELNNTIIAFAYDRENGRLTEIQTVTTLPASFTGVSYCAEIRVHPSGRFLYGSNRGHDSIAVFAVDEETGRIEPVAHTPTNGSWPRHFNLDPTGRLLLVANERSDSIYSFRIDQETGCLTPTGYSITIPNPMCVVIIPGC